MEILLPVIIVLTIGLIAGVGLSIASVLMAVPVDEKVEEVRAVLPGANCGACGYSGCDGYAKAVAEGAAPSLCAPGGADVAAQVASIMGLEAGEMRPKSAVVHCNGTCGNTERKMNYTGIKSCAAANMMFSGTGKCSFGCLGFGDCVKACDYDAIAVIDGIATVYPERCKACGQCVTACPKKIISIVEGDSPAVVRCQNHDKGGETRKACKVGCIGCMRCVKACEFGAVSVKDFCAAVDFEKCTACGKCTEVCPSKCIDLYLLKVSGR